jgi:hypothetical protein
MISPEASAFDRLLDSISGRLTPEVARWLVDLRADPEVQSRVDLLADKCTEGDLTPEERAEYESYVRATSLIAILQAKARNYLKNLPTA